MSSIPVVVRVIPAVDSALCALSSSYTFISILDHERWMKEWGDDHEAVPVMHLKYPMLSAAIVMGLGGIVAPEGLALATIELNGTLGQARILNTFLVVAGAIVTMSTMLHVARKDVFGGVDRVEKLRVVIVQRYTISELKTKKGLGKKIAYFGQLQHIVAAGVVLGVGIFSCWSLSMLGFVGNFVVVWKAWPVTGLAVILLMISVAITWLLFRVLVWKPAHEMLRPICAVFIAIALWWTDHLGRRHAVRYESSTGPDWNSPWSLPLAEEYSHWVLELFTFCAVLTQYAIALELRTAYCGLQDANLDLQILSGTADHDEMSRKVSAIKTRKRRSTAQGSRSPTSAGRSRRRTSVVLGTPPRIASPSATMTMTAAHLTTPSGVVKAVFRLGSSMNAAGMKNSRSIRVKPLDVGKVYDSPVSEDDERADDVVNWRNSEASIGWDTVQPFEGGALVEVGPLKKVDLPSGEV